MYDFECQNFYGSSMLDLTRCLPPDHCQSSQEPLRENTEKLLGENPMMIMALASFSVKEYGSFFKMRRILPWPAIH